MLERYSLVEHKVSKKHEYLPEKHLEEDKRVLFKIKDNLFNSISYGCYTRQEICQSIVDDKNDKWQNEPVEVRECLVKVFGQE